MIDCLATVKAPGLLALAAAGIALALLVRRTLRSRSSVRAAQSDPLHSRDTDSSIEASPIETYVPTSAALSRGGDPDSPPAPPESTGDAVETAAFSDTPAVRHNNDTAADPETSPILDSEIGASATDADPLGVRADVPSGDELAVDEQPIAEAEVSVGDNISEPVVVVEPIESDATAGIPEAEEPPAEQAILGASAAEAEGAIEPDLTEAREPSAAPTRTPRQYRPPRSAPGRASPKQSSAPVTASALERALEIEVRVLFERGGFCRISLMPHRDESIKGEITAVDATGPIELTPLQDDFYGDVFHPDLGSSLRNGVEWTAALEGGPRLRWSLAGREVYVLAPDEHISGYLSTTRLRLGEEEVVLCADERAHQIREIIAATGSPAPVIIGSSEGLPRGWTGFRGVIPAKSIPQSSDHDILNVLRPLPDLAIGFVGGIRLTRNSWLAECPPNIRLRGDLASGTDVLIDGATATRTEAGTYVAAGWDNVGDHTVWCASVSRSYQIRPGLEDWAGWDAYQWSLEGNGANGVGANLSVCGPLVRGPRLSNSEVIPRVVCTPNPVLIGAAPGEVARGSIRPTLRTREGIAVVSFEPVWALPFDPFHCDKRTSRIIALADLAPLTDDRLLRPAGRREVQAWSDWCAAILDAARKGLAVEPNDPRTIALWAEYRRRAHALRKRLP